MPRAAPPLQIPTVRSGSGPPGSTSGGRPVASCEPSASAASETRLSRRPAHRERRAAVVHEPVLRRDAEHAGELRVVAELAVRVQRQVVRRERDPGAEERLEATAHERVDDARVAVPEEAVVHDQEIGRERLGALEHLERRGDGDGDACRRRRGPRPAARSARSRGSDRSRAPGRGSEDVVAVHRHRRRESVSPGRGSRADARARTAASSVARSYAP